MGTHKKIQGHGGKTAVTKDDNWDYHEHMLCPDCEHYMKNGGFGCHISTEILAFNLKYGVSAAIFECSEFKEKEKK